MNALPIRGAGTTSSKIGVGSAVGIFIDCTYPSRPGCCPVAQDIGGQV